MEKIKAKCCPSVRIKKTTKPLAEANKKKRTNTSYQLSGVEVVYHYRSCSHQEEKQCCQQLYTKNFN